MSGRRRSTSARLSSMLSCPVSARTTTSTSPRTASIRRRRSGSAIARSRPVTTTLLTTSPAASSAGADSRCFRRSRSSISIPGPLEPTPGGQAISLVDFANPDFERFPRFREALDAGVVADVEPGDAVFIPSMWWHHVQGLSAFNTLVNYWWSKLPAFIPTPDERAVSRDLDDARPAGEREARLAQRLRVLRVRRRRSARANTSPESARGVLGPIDDDQARFIRAMLINKLNR